MEPLATRYPIGDSVTMASHFLSGIPFPFASTSTHPNHGCTLCSDCLIPGGLAFDYVTEVWDPPDTINLGMMCSARVISRSHCTEFTSLGMEGLGKTTISGSQSLKNIDINVYYSRSLVNLGEIDGFPFKGLGIECYYMMICRKLKTLNDLKRKIMEELNLNLACYDIKIIYRYPQEVLHERINYGYMAIKEDKHVKIMFNKIH